MPGGLLQTGLNSQSVWLRHREGNGLQMGLGAAAANHIGKTSSARLCKQRGGGHGAKK